MADVAPELIKNRRGLWEKTRKENEVISDETEILLTED